MLLFLLAISEDSVLKVFERKVEKEERFFLREIENIFSVPKGYLFPKLYLFYDEINITPIPFIKVQYADTINLRIVDREIPIGYSYIRRWGWGFVWNPLNPKVVLSIKSANLKRKYYEELTRVKLSRLKTNLRITLRIIANIDSIVSLSDSVLDAMERFELIMDTLRRLKRTDSLEVLELISHKREIKGISNNFRDLGRRLKDSLEDFAGIKVDKVKLMENFKPSCEEVPQSLKIKYLRYDYLSESLWWVPSLYLFGEVWDGNVKTPSTLHGFRIVVEFDETKRLFSKAKKSIYEIGKLKLRKYGKENYDFQEDMESLITSFSDLVKYAGDMYNSGVIGYDKFLGIYLRYFDTKVKVLQLRVKKLKESICQIPTNEYQYAEYYGSFEGPAINWFDSGYFQEEVEP